VKSEWMSITDGQIYLLQAEDSKSVMFEEHYSGLLEACLKCLYTRFGLCASSMKLCCMGMLDSNLLAAKRSTLFVETEAILSDTGEQLDFKW
jgi:hypothetical protein